MIIIITIISRIVTVIAEITDNGNKILMDD